MAENLDVPHSDINGSATIQDEPSSDEGEVIAKMDDYMDEVHNAVLFARFEEDISSFVTYSVIKGYIRDVEQEVVRQIASKDTEITVLNQKLQQVGNGGLSFSEGRDKRYDEIYNIRQQLDAISKSLLSSEWWHSGSHYNSEGAEDVNKLRSKEQLSRNGPTKENGHKATVEVVFGDPSCLKHMDKDALIAHFNKEMNQMKREHDSALEKKTEEIFKLKRDLYNKEGSNSGHLRNNKEYEQMRKIIGEVSKKLDGLLSENKRSTCVIKADAFPVQQDKTNAIDPEVQQAQGATTNDEEEACTTPTQGTHFASIEAGHLEQIRMLESDIEDARIATVIREEIERILAEEFVNEMQIRLHSCEMEFNMKEEICSVIQSEAIVEAMTNINSSLLKYNEEKSCAKSASLQKPEIEKLKLAVDSFSELVRQKAEFVSQIELEAMKGRMDLLCHELDLLRHKVENQDSYISDKGKEFDVMIGRLEQAVQHVHRNEINLNELGDRFRAVTDSLKKMEEQNQVLCTIIEEKEKIFTSTISKEKELKEHMKCVVESVKEFENFVTDQQTAIANRVQHSELRVCLLKEQCKHLTKEGNHLKRKALRYKEISETRGSNLQKAELEVDLLADEVEALTDLLAKIYIALDHYSPVLRHYTGVMETLNLIKKHISLAK